jgi:serine/threonine-protein kinase RsbW
MAAMRGLQAFPTMRGRAPLAADAAVRLSLPARPEKIAMVRRALEAIAEERGLPQRMLEDMRLAVTEACTNVVRHAYDDDEVCAGDAMRVELRPYDGGMRVVVEDRGRGLAPSPDLGGPGLGLPMIAALATDVEIRQAPGEGSRVAMSFSPAPAGAAA